MDSSDGLDLDSLIDLIEENDSEAQRPKRLKVDVDLFSALSSGGDAKEGSSSLVHTGDTSEEEGECLTEAGQQIRQKVKPKSNWNDDKREKSTWKSVSKPSSDLKDGSFDKVIGIRIINPLVSFDVMQRRLRDRRLVGLTLMRNSLHKGDIQGDWVTVGVVVKKVPPKTSKNGKVFSIWKLSDLSDASCLVSLFLFGEVHKEHWKTSTAAVVGLLNPTFMEARDKEEYASLTVDHPGKIMHIGTSKDFGHCKSVRKDGTQCNNVVNLSRCQFCTYHVKNEYKKFSKRSDIQTSWSGRDLSLKDRVLKGQNFFYAGQSFTPLGKAEKKSRCISQKDRLTLSSLTLKRKAEEVFHKEEVEGRNIKRTLKDMYGEGVSRAAEKNSQFINQRLMIPSPGSRNLLHLMGRNQSAKEESSDVKSAKDLLKQNMLLMNARNLPPPPRRDDATILRNLTPVLGKGLSPGQRIAFDLSARNSNTPEHYAKIRAIQKIRQNGPIQKRDPNAVQSNPEPKKIQALLLEEEGDNCSGGGVQWGKLGSIDLNSEKVQKYLKQKSSHAFEVEMAEMEREAAYFARMEVKEQMEEKMSAQKEIVCDVVSCKQCRYTAHQAADRCKSECHPLKCHKAIKRFFECQDCRQRTECFSRFPLHSCRNCGGSRFQRTGMMKVRSGPKLDSEILHITGDDVKNLNSL